MLAAVIGSSTPRGTRAWSRRARAARRGAAVLGLLALLLCPAAAAAGAPADRAATSAYLAASVRLDEAILANAHSSLLAADSLAARLQRECPRVLAGVPQPSSPGPLLNAGPRTRGEDDRLSQQETALRYELEENVIVAALGPDRGAIAAYASAVKGLAWSDPRLTGLVAASAALFEAEATFPASNVCADMRSWVASGYRTIASATRESELRFDAILAPVDATYGHSMTCTGRSAT